VSPQGTEPQIVGGMFGLQCLSTEGEAPPFLRSKHLLLANARSGIRLLVDLLSPPHVWMPSYLCNVMLQAVKDTEPRFYEVDYDLSIRSLAWLDRVGEGDLVLVIDYFGFPADNGVIAQAKERKVWVVEDAAQALLSQDVGQCSDFLLYSPRKYLGVPDGGILVANDLVPWSKVELQSPPAHWWLRALQASILRREFDRYGGDRRWFQIFRETDTNGPIGRYAMSELSRLLLLQRFDYGAIAQRRIDNYQILMDTLGELALFTHLPQGVVPLGFPICLRSRDRVRQALFEHAIYPPVHWKLERTVPDEFEASHRLSSEIMTLPCDQRYQEHHMVRMAELVRREALI
jgi:dTDP-4-amino-4,6-dideoxygalactose transaminase